MEMRTATSVLRPIQYIEIDMRNRTAPEFRTVFHSPLGVPNSQVPLYYSTSIAAASCNDHCVSLVRGLVYRKFLSPETNISSLITLPITVFAILKSIS